MSSPLEISELRNLDELVRLEPEWWELWRRCPSATPFQTPAWLIPWWRAFAPGELLVVAARAGARLVGLAPLYLESGEQGRRILPLGISISDYLDLLAEAAQGRSIVERLIGFLQNSPVPWDSLELTELPPGAAALEISAPSGCEEERGTSNIAPVLEVPDGTERLEDLLPSRKKRALRMASNRAKRRGAVEFIAGDLHSAAEMLTLLIRLHGARWESRCQSGVLADRRLHEFHAEAIPRLLRAGLARLYLLRIGGEPAAVYYGFVHRRSSYAYLTGFDPGFAYESPGSLLLAHAIEQAMGEGVREVHFLRGREAYKYGWGVKDRANLRRVFTRSHAYAA